MDRTARNHTPRGRGRGRGWSHRSAAPTAKHRHHPVGRGTENQYWRPVTKDISPGGENPNLVCDASHVAEAETPIRKNPNLVGDVSHVAEVETPIRENPNRVGDASHVAEAETPIRENPNWVGDVSHVAEAESPIRENPNLVGDVSHVAEAESPIRENPNLVGDVSHVAEAETPIMTEAESPIRENPNLVGDVSHVAEAETPIIETCFYAAVVYSKNNFPPNSRDERLEPLGLGKEQKVNAGGEKSGSCLHLEPTFSGSSAHRHVSVAGANSSPEISSGSKDDMPSYGTQNSKTRSGINGSKQFASNNRQSHNSSSEKNYRSNLVDKSLESGKGQMINSAKSGGSMPFDPSLAVDNTNTVFPVSDLKGKPLNDGFLSDQSPWKQIKDSGNSYKIYRQSYDICPPKRGDVLKLKQSLFEQNKIKREEAKLFKEGQTIKELRSGMILLKKYISLTDQIRIIKECRDLGRGTGGFYEPGYKDGGKLQLKMMCLGKNWDPEKSEYGDKRQIDGAKPPSIPNGFHQLVKGAIEASHSFLREHSKPSNNERVLPSMSPNICIVNFYTKSGRLGLHQDKDESKESINQGLPVVSFSIGDSAEFLYSDQRDPEKAEQVVLESGDVLIFGGKSRLVFHGVKSIVADTAPKGLLEETGLRPGRLNLTFREY